MTHQEDEVLRLLIEIQSKDTLESEPEPKWQPVMLIAKRRVECACGALAIFISLEQQERAEGKPADVLYSAWCQSCWAKEIEADDDEVS